MNNIIISFNSWVNKRKAKTKKIGRKIKIGTEKGIDKKKIRKKKKKKEATQVLQTVQMILQDLQAHQERRLKKKTIK